MGKRRTKKQLRQLEDGIKLSLILVAGAAYYLTQKLYITLLIVGMVMILILVLFVLQNKRKKSG